MKRSDFLKICLTGLTAMLALRWLKLFDSVDGHGLKEARFYKSADTFLG